MKLIFSHAERTIFARMASNKPPMPKTSASDIVFPSAALLVLVAGYSLYLVLATNDMELAESYAGFYLFPAAMLGLLGIVGGMLAASWKPEPHAQARRRRIVATLVGLGSLVFTHILLG